jgi:YNFM family putative membrane transporter
MHHPSNHLDCADQQNPMHPRDTTTPYTGFAALVCLLLLAVLVLSQLYLAIPLTPYLVEHFQRDTAAITLGLASSFSLSYALGFLIWGPVSDHYGRRVVLLIGMLMLLAGTLACAFAPSLAWLTAIRCLQGLAASSFAPVALAWLSEVYTGKRRATAIGAMVTAFLLAGIFGQVLASWLALHWDWRWVFILSALALALLTLLLAAQVYETVHQDRILGALYHRFIELFGFAIRPATLLLSIAHFSSLLSFVAMYTALGWYLAVFDLEPMAVLWLRLAALPCMFAALLVGPLAARIGMSRVAIVGYVLAALGLLLQALGGSWLWLIVSASLVFVTGIALAVPSMISQFARLAAPNLGMGMAINGFVLFVGASVGPIVAISWHSFSLLMLGLAMALLLAALCVAASAKLSR